VIDEYVLAGAFVAVVLLGWLWVKRWGPARGRPLASGVWAFLLLVALGLIMGAGGVAIADLLAGALSIPVLWLVALEAFVALALRVRQRRRSAHS
jgi:hypothetical protein